MVLNTALFIFDGQYRIQKPVLVLQIAVRRLHGARLQVGVRYFLRAVDAALLVGFGIFRVGISINRALEEGSAHKNYYIEYQARRNRLTHSMCFEEF